MHEDLIDQYGLKSYQTEIESISKECLIGVEVDEITHSYFGGLPIVDDDFIWPTKKGYPLHLIGQIECRDLSLVPMESGRLLFFYDCRHWGQGYRMNLCGFSCEILQ